MIDLYRNWIDLQEASLGFQKRQAALAEQMIAAQKQTMQALDANVRAMQGWAALWGWAPK